MNVRDPLLPVQPDEAGALAAFVDRTWDERDRAGADRLHRDPGQEPDVRCRLAAARPHRARGHRRRALGRAPGDRRAEARDRAPRGPHAGDLLRGAGDAGRQRRHGLLYGHLDKQPEFNGWRNDLGPWTPKLEDDQLYGRGGADDGYAVYAALTAIAALDAQGIARPRCVGLIESCEESGSLDLPAYIDALQPRLGDVSLVVCLDSGAGNYDQLWLTTSLRGMVSGVLKVEILTEGMHSGDASGLVPSSFRILRHVLDRLEDRQTGRLLPESFHCAIPAERIEQARADRARSSATRSGSACRGPAAPTAARRCRPPPIRSEALLNRTWRPTLSVTGVDGFPALGDAGNVLRPYTAFKLSLRLPPLVDGQRRRAAAEDAARGQRAVQRQGHVRRPTAASARYGATGWNAPALAPWLEDALNAASQRALRRAVRLHRPGRHDPADEPAAAGLPDGADDGLRRARPEEQRPRAERVPARAVRQEADGRGGAGDRGLPVSDAPPTAA